MVENYDNVLINLNAKFVFDDLLVEGNKKFLIGKDELRKEIQNVMKRGIYKSPPTKRDGRYDY